MNLLELPLIYNLRFLVAGDQFLTKEFIQDNYKKFSCKSVLDVGCGTGDFSILFKKEDYLGIDISKKYIKFAKEKYNYNFITADVVNYDFKKKFDCTIFISSMHHLSDEQMKKILIKIIKITKKVIIVIDLNPETTFVKKFLIDNDRGKYVRSTDKKINLLSKFGKIVKIEHFSTRLASQSGLVLIPKK